jgi:hypothetical protein
MKATTILKDEHRVIEQVIDCLERIANEAERSGGMDTAAMLRTKNSPIDWPNNWAFRRCIERAPRTRPSGEPVRTSFK